MSDPVVEETSSVTSTPAKQLKADFSSFAVDQEYEGKVISAKNFGIFVDILSGYNVLLPRSLLSNSVYERLKKMATEKSAELIKIAIVGLSAENQTLSGKYIPPPGKERSDFSALSNIDLKSKMFNATIVSSHEFGLFAVLDELNVEGLVPASKIPSTTDGKSIKDTYK
jgi:ribosomal protein S1